jgi:hypothetical protein
VGVRLKSFAYILTFEGRAMPEFRSAWADWHPDPESPPIRGNPPQSAGIEGFEGGVLRHISEITPIEGNENSEIRTSRAPSIPSKPPEELCPADQLNTDWRSATTRARDGFARHGIEPTAECLEGAAALELKLADELLPPLGSEKRDLIRKALVSVYAGRATAQAKSSGRVGVRNVYDPARCLADL